MLNFKKILLMSYCLSFLNMYSSTLDENSPLSQAAFLLKQKQTGRQVASNVLFKIQSESFDRPNARKVNHRKKRIRKKQIIGKVLQALVQMQEQHNQAIARRLKVCDMRIG